jgi:hypothetical protein
MAVLGPDVILAGAAVRLAIHAIYSSFTILSLDGGNSCLLQAVIGSACIS